MARTKIKNTKKTILSLGCPGYAPASKTVVVESTAMNRTISSVLNMVLAIVALGCSIFELCDDDDDGLLKMHS